MIKKIISKENVDLSNNLKKKIDDWVNKSFEDEIEKEGQGILLLYINKNSINYPARRGEVVCSDMIENYRKYHKMIINNYICSKLEEKINRPIKSFFVEDDKIWKDFIDIHYIN